MMKFLCIVLLAASTQAFAPRVTREAHIIPTPRLVRITLVDNPSLGFQVDWTRVSAQDGSDPILGYKVKVWEQPKVKTYKYEIVNGVSKLVEEEAPAKFSNNDSTPTHKPRDITVNGGDKTSALVDGIETGVAYEVRVLAYTKSGDGPLSQPMRIEISNNDSDRRRDEYTVV